MSLSQPPIGQLVNFTAASRKSALISSFFFSPNDNFPAAIWGPNTTGVGTETPLIGAIDGVNLVFTSPITVVQGIMLFLNGLLQDSTSSYTLAGNTVTFTTAPQVGDTIQAVVS